MNIDRSEPEFRRASRPTPATSRRFGKRGGHRVVSAAYAIMILGRRTKPRVLPHGLLALALGAVTLATLPAPQTSAPAQRAGGKLVPSAGALLGSTIGAGVPAKLP